MRNLLFLLLLVVAPITLLAQSTVVYKRNPFTGVLEVYQSVGGFPTGSPIYKIKRNLYGYLEVENVDASTDPYTRKPNYSGYNNFKPYQLPAKEIFETLENLNKRAEFDYILSQPETSNSNFEKGYNEVIEYIQKRSLFAKSLVEFYNGNISFPTKIDDGWHEVVSTSNLGTLGLDYKYGICKISNNKIEEYYENLNIFDLKTGYVFQKIKLDVISPIKNCRSTYRAAGSEKYNTIYFMDNILDSTKKIENPNFGYFTIYTEPNFYLPSNSVLSFNIARNMTLTREQISNFSGTPYSAVLDEINPQDQLCTYSLMTLAFRKPLDKFSIGIYNFSNKKVWLLNNITITSNTCNSTILTQ